VQKSSHFFTLIENTYADLSPNARKIANYLQHNPMDIITHSVADIAAITSTSKASVSRFFRQLGYDSHLDVKQEMRQLRARGYPLKSVMSEQSDVEQELSRFSEGWQNINQTDIDGLIQAICEAPRIKLIGFRNSYPVAMHFRQQLLQMRGKVRLIPQPGQTLSEELADIEDDELVILIGFRRRPRIFKTLIERLNEMKGGDSQSGPKLALLTDPSGQIYRQQVSHLFLSPLGDEQALDSYAVPMSIVSVICNRVFAAIGTKAQQRTGAISDLYNQMEELEKF
jgi:DNA-binding MurR/RpiR family transcriptional regulator